MQEVYVDNKAHSDNTDAGEEVLVEFVHNWHYIRNYRDGDLLVVRKDPVGHIEGQDDMQLYAVGGNDLQRSHDRYYCRRSEEAVHDTLHQQMMTKYGLQQ